jgi:NADH-quinone oxidoreductase subunit M
MPKFAAFVMLFSMANAGCPRRRVSSASFWSSWPRSRLNFWIAFLAATSLILGAAYTLWMYKRRDLRRVANADVAALTDLESARILAARSCSPRRSW